MNLVDELKRRNVFRVGMAYVVIAWLVAQVADLALDNFDAPVWVIKSILTLLALGFPIALFFAWAFELTPEGIKKEEDVDRSESITQKTSRKLDYTIVGVLIIALAYFVWESRIAGDRGQTSEVSQQQTNGTAGTTDVSKENRSIAVLPFVALSTDENDSFFGKGLAEELLNALAQFPDLKVAARTSAFAYGDANVDLREVGEALGVAHVLEGSVRRSGERIRVTAQLIRAKDGFHLWSDTFERADSDIFVIQDEIVAQLSNVLQFRLGVGAGAGRAARQNVSPRAYEEYLRGLDFWWNRESTVNNRVRAVATLRQATELDANFADAWSAYGAALALSTSALPTGLTVQEHWSVATSSLLRALELDPDNARAHAALVFVYSFNKPDISAAERHLQKALDVAKNNPFTVYAVASNAWAVGDIRRSLEFFDHALTLDPLNQTLVRQKRNALLGAGRFDEAIATYECGKNDCDGFNLRYSIFFDALMAGTIEDVREQSLAIRGVIPDDFPASSVLEFYLTYADVLLGESVDAKYWRTVDLTGRQAGFASYLNVSILAQMGEVTRALDVLFESMATSDSVFQGSASFLTLMSTRLEMPESIRRHPRYHEFWNMPGMPELAAARRANGVSAGLPLPIDGSDE